MIQIQIPTRFSRLLIFLVFTCMVLLQPTRSSCQVLYRPNFFGLKAGTNTAKTVVNGSDLFISKYNTGFHLGGFYHARFGKFVVQPEILYQVKGGTFRNSDVLIRNNYNYITVPIIVGYVVTEGLTVEAGAEWSRALNGVKSIGPEVNRDFGITAGVRFDLLDAADKFSLNLRYNYGTANISAIPGIQKYNRAIQFSVIYNFYKEK